MPLPDRTPESANNRTAVASRAVISARPQALSFLYRYLFSFTPVLLAFLCMGIRIVLDSLFLAAAPMVSDLSPVPAAHSSDISRGAMAQYLGMMSISTAGYGDLAAITILLVVPVGTFLLAAGIGSSLRRAELWTGPVLTIILSSGAAYVLAGSTSFSMAYLLLLLQWIAFLVQPFSIVASVAVLLGTEIFRRSIRYTITPDAVVILGGVFGKVEQTLPHHRISRVIFEQDLIGSLFNFGTVIPQSSTSTEGSVSSDAGAGSAGSAGASRNPLACLFGIPDPNTAQRIIESRMNPPARDEWYVTGHGDRDCSDQKTAN
jgi:membrane protein YdbS with pleckstrin-like domain